MVSEQDPRRWLALASLLLALFLVVLGNTVLNVAIPTMVEDLDTELSVIQWVVTGYALVFATLLVIGGRLGDVFGARRMFVLGATLFGIGSVFGATAPTVGLLLFGEALVKGSGAALMMPASLAIVSNTFRGEERTTAFAAWGAVLGAGMAFGPVFGGYMTSYHSWRWAIAISIVVAPLTAVAALALVPPDASRPGARPRLDLPGAVLVAVGTFCLVFSISQSNDLGWLSVPTVTILAVAVGALALFVRVERRKERDGEEALFEFGQLRHLRFRYGLLAQIVLAMGQMGQFFVLPIFLQGAKGLTPAQNGLWMLPVGVAIVIFAQVGGRLARVFGTTTIVRVGLVMNALGLLAMVLVLEPDLAFLALLPGMTVFGAGVGLASSQLTNVILADIDPDKAGVASGANSTVRQVGSALGVATMGAVLAGRADVAAASRLAVLVAAVIIGVGAALAFLIPPDRRHEEEHAADPFFAVGEPAADSGARR